MNKVDTKNIVVGLKQTLSQMKQKNVTAVFLALDADEEIKNKIRAHCENTNIEIRDAKSMRLLGKACAISRPAACAAILKKKKGGEEINAND
ncbi:MAG: 50S ribosomal protein L7 [Eubacteriaceae bacterium]|nr:50S ribosomal protein L7 [Eubacteriaceae bacterium]